MKNLIRALCLSLLMASWSASAPAAEPLQLKIGHVRPVGSTIDQDVRRLTRTITAATGGRLRFEVFQDNKLGDYSVVQERCSFGEVDFYVGPLGTMTDRRLALPNIPFLVESWDQARLVYGADGLLMKRMAKILAGQNIKLLGGWPVYFGGILLTARPPSPADPDVPKKMILRVPPMRSFSLTARALGYAPYPITWVYAKTGLRTGMVDGLIGGGPEGYLGSVGPAKYYLRVKDHFENWYVYMNLDLWNKLSPKEQATIESAVRSMGARRFEVAEAEERANLQRLESQGIEVVLFSEEAYARMRTKVQKTVWPVLEKEIGSSFRDVVASAQP